MTRHTVRHDDGDAKKGPHGGDLFWSDKDGDSRPDERQTVYEDRGLWRNEEQKDKYYDPRDNKVKDK